MHVSLKSIWNKIYFLNQNRIIGVNKSVILKFTLLIKIIKGIHSEIGFVFHIKIIQLNCDHKRVNFVSCIRYLKNSVTICLD